MNGLDKAWASCVRTERADYPRPLFWYPAASLYVRDRGDLGTVLDQHINYKLARTLPYPPGAVLLDVGGFVGDSVWYFLTETRKMARIVSIEPDPDNAAVFRVNCGKDPRVTLLEAAVVSDGSEFVNLFLGNTYAANHSLEGYRGRAAVRVPALDFAALLREHQPDAVKCNIEGGEFLLDWETLPDTVTEVYMELHQHRPAWLAAAEKLDHTLLGMGFRHLMAPVHREVFQHRQRAIWTRR